mgnify:CR=1 FL=1
MSFQLHLTAGMLGTSTLCLIGIFIFQKVDFVCLGCELQNARLKLIATVFVNCNDACFCNSPDSGNYKVIYQNVKEKVK